MYKQRFAIKILDGIFITAACLTPFLYETVSYWFIALTVVLTVLAFVFPALYASGVAGGRLKVCSYGTTILSVFPFTLLVVVPAFIVSLFFNEDLGWTPIITYACVTIGLLNIYFWTGIIIVYLTSKQIGIGKRLLGIFCGMIPVANLFVLSIIVKISAREIREESERYWRNEARIPNQICKTKYPILMVHGVFFRDSAPSRSRRRSFRSFRRPAPRRSTSSPTAKAASTQDTASPCSVWHLTLLHSQQSTLLTGAVSSPNIS